MRPVITHVQCAVTALPCNCLLCPPTKVCRVARGVSEPLETFPAALRGGSTITADDRVNDYCTHVKISDCKSGKGVNDEDQERGDIELYAACYELVSSQKVHATSKQSRCPESHNSSQNSNNDSEHESCDLDERYGKSSQNCVSKNMPLPATSKINDCSSDEDDISSVAAEPYRGCVMKYTCMMTIPAKSDSIGAVATSSSDTSMHVLSMPAIACAAQDDSDPVGPASANACSALQLVKTAEHTDLPGVFDLVWSPTPAQKLSSSASHTLEILSRASSECGTCTSSQANRTDPTRSLLIACTDGSARLLHRSTLHACTQNYCNLSSTLLTSCTPIAASQGVCSQSDKNHTGTMSVAHSPTRSPIVDGASLVTHDNWRTTCSRTMPQQATEISANINTNDIKDGSPKRRCEECSLQGLVSTAHGGAVRWCSLQHDKEKKTGKSTRSTTSVNLKPHEYDAWCSAVLPYSCYARASQSQNCNTLCSSRAYNHFTTATNAEYDDNVGVQKHDQTGYTHDTHQPQNSIDSTSELAASVRIFVSGGDDGIVRVHDTRCVQRNGERCGMTCMQFDAGVTSITPVLPSFYFEDISRAQRQRQCFASQGSRYNSALCPLNDTHTAYNANRCSANTASCDAVISNASTTSPFDWCTGVHRLALSCACSWEPLCCSVPPYLLVGSYDESIALLDLRMIRTRQPVARCTGLGGGVWRTSRTLFPRDLCTLKNDSTQRDTNTLPHKSTHSLDDADTVSEICFVDNCVNDRNVLVLPLMQRGAALLAYDVCGRMAGGVFGSPMHFPMHERFTSSSSLSSMLISKDAPLGCGNVQDERKEQEQRTCCDKDESCVASDECLVYDTAVLFSPSASRSGVVATCSFYEKRIDLWRLSPVTLDSFLVS